MKKNQVQVNAEALKGILYEQLLRLSHEDLDGNKAGLKLETERAKAISAISSQILNVEKLKIQSTSIKLNASKLLAQQKGGLNLESIESEFFESDSPKRLGS